MNVDIDEFVATTLRGICAGVAKFHAESTGAHVPANIYALPGTPELATVGGRKRHVVFVDFDIAVSASKETGASAKVVVIPALGVGGGHTRAGSSVSRVTFRIPIVLPGAEDDSDDSLDMKIGDIGGV